jgi:hypothetical protein
MSHYLEDQGCQVQRVRLERLRVIGPMENRLQVMNSLYADGFDVTQSGPYTDVELHPKVDSTHFLFIAEREIQS